MVVTLQEVLVKTLRRLNDSSLKRFIEKLSAWKVRKEYKNIPKDELMGKDPEHVAGLIIEYYRYAYGAELILDVLEDIDEMKVREKLQYNLRKVDILGHGLGTTMFTDRINFIDHHRLHLIRELTDVDSVLRDLRKQKLLTREKYNDVMIKKTSQEKMKELCDIITHWEDTGKYTAYIALKIQNGKIIRDLETESLTWRNTWSHAWYMIRFIDRHRSALIRRITDVDSVLRDLRDQKLLTEEKYNDVMGNPTSQEKMEELCDIITHWENPGKYTAYIVLMKHNKLIIKDLEAEDMTRRTPEIVWGREDHFLDRHEYHLINDVKEVNAVLEDLLANRLLTAVQYEDVQSKTRRKNKMRRLFHKFRHQPDRVKDELYISLWRFNYKVINSLEKSEEYLVKNMPQAEAQGYANTRLQEERLDTSSIFEFELKETTAPQTSCVKTTVDNISCKLCGEPAQDSADLVTPMTIGNKHRLELKSPGLYRCLKTGIKFLVGGPVIIEYNIDSWSHHLKDIPYKSYEILGPLFNIQTCGEPDALPAVYLPHYLCLVGFSEDLSMIKCAHFRDGNMTLESPTQIEPFYIKLDNPLFSCLGPFLLFKKKKIPIHGIVLIYFRILCRGYLEEEYKIHLYVLPYSTNAEETLDKENSKFGFQRIKKHEQTTDTVYTKIKYLVTGHPGLSAHPKTLKFDSEPYQLTEIRLKEKDVNIFLCVSEEISKEPVWDAHLTQSDLKDITQLLSPLTIHEGAHPPPSEHFVDRNRETLIERTSNINPLLDQLLSNKLLTQEQYDTVRSGRTCQEKMRQLYGCTSIWGYSEKEIFYQVLKTTNPFLIRDLQK